MPVRYLEPLVPAVAAVLGIGIAYLATASTRVVARRGRAAYIGASLLLAGCLAATLVYQHSTRAIPATALVGAAGAAIALAATWVALRAQAPRRWASWVSALVAGFALLGVLAAPASQSFALVRASASDGGSLGAMPAKTVTALSRYLTRHRGGRRYEFAAYETATAAPLIVADDQPVLILAGTPFHTLVSVRGLSRAVRAGQVRYVLLSAVPANHLLHPFPPRSARSEIPAWVIRHGVDVTQATGLRGYGILYRLSARG
jgi:hypothetical protein